MTIAQIAYIYLATVPIFFAIDMVWLGVVARKFYANQLVAFLGDVNWVAAMAFYLLYIGGILVFAVLPALRAGSLITAVALGAFLGLVAYATYDLTNYATIRDWPLAVTIVDMIWGAVLTGSVAALSYIVADRFIL